VTSDAALLRCRSVLFVPAVKVELLAKVPRWSPDIVAVDLEDAVAAPDKDSARELLATADLSVPGSTVLVRVNAPGTPWHEADLAMAAGSGAAGVILPKAEDPAVLAGIADRLPDGAVLMAGIETAQGVANARALLATDGVNAGYFGSEDFSADMGGRRTPGGLEVLYARSEVVLAGRLAGVPVVDQPVTALEDDAAFTADADAGRDLGYAGKVCIHPRQVALAHAVFTPSEAEIAAARRILAAAGDSGVAVIDGEFVDAVHVRLAHQVLARAGQEQGAGEQQ
jgi:citrate lyase subunit beta/citryl-CoA lyase